MKLKKLWRFISAHEKVIVKLLLKDGFGSVEECVKIYKDPSWISLEAEVRQVCTRDGVLYIEVEKL